MAYFTRRYRNFGSLFFVVTLVLFYLLFEHGLVAPQLTRIIHKLGVVRPADQNMAPTQLQDEGGLYVDPGSVKNISNEFRQRLKDVMGLEPAEDHVFKSPYIETPAVYPHAKPRPPGKRKKKLISVFKAAAWYAEEDSEWMYNRDFKHCEYSECEIDLTGDKIPTADVVFVFPQHVVGKTDPPPRREGQIWVMASPEPPTMYKYPQPYGKWKGQFNLTYNYRLDSDIWTPIGRLAWRHKDLLLSDAEYLEIANRKTRPVAWFLNRCFAESQREGYGRIMRQYIDVDIYGRCGKHKCPKSEMTRCMSIVNDTYHFYLGFENSFCKDYITEKFFRNFQDPRIHVIPVTRGAVDYHKYFPRGGFINALDFPSPKELALYLKDVIADKQKYAHMLREKDRLVRLPYTHDWCELCKKLHTTGFPEKVIPDIKTWSHGRTCISKQAVWEYPRVGNSTVISYL